ncbi:MAG: chitobiase/beta-hexosaminidase C-terminal domain-containing protein, partial [Muribaculaceae bacterium]|nr:chitobiase/beta-hexosaminidase C-terminal domain-containing protein [Muribaculaceae bacterium]
MTLTISGMSSRYKITGVTLNVHNNASSGNGDADVTMDGVSIGSMSITGLGNTYSEQDVTITECPFTGDLVITLTCTTNSVYCNAFYIDYEEIPAKTYDVTVTQATGGTITASPVGEDVVDTGDEVIVSYTLDEGYEFGSWNITGATGPVNGVLTVTGDVTITATFNKVNYTLTRSSNSLSMGDVKITDASGNELGTQPTTAQMGDVVYFKLKTEYGYQPTSNPVTVTNTTAGTTITPEGPTNGVYHFTMPAGNVTIAATFQAYHGTLRLAGRFNGNTGWRTGTSGPAFTYDSANDKYTIDAYFTGEGDGNYFFITYDGNASYPSADGNWVVTNTTGTPVALTWDGNGHNFYIDNGVYTIELPGDLSTIAFTKKTPTITFNPASGSEVEQGTSVSATSTLTDLVSAIQDENKGGTVTVTCNPATLNTIGSNQTVTATATIGNYSESATATYTVVAVNNSNQFELVTDLSTQLIAGKKYIIVSENNNSAYSGNGDSATEITISNHTTTVDPTDVAYLTLGGSTGAWTFNFTRNGSVYNVYHTSTTAVKDNSFGASTTATPSEFSISLNSGAFDISADGKHLRANSATDFRFYDANSSGSAIQLYRQMAEEVKDYTIDYAVVTGGSATGAASANEGEEITVTVTAESGYACTGISVTGVAASDITDNNDGTYTFTMPASNVTVTPTFASAYAITYVANPTAGGTVAGVASAVEDARVYVTVTPNADYQLESLVYSWNDGASSQSVSGAGTAENPYYFNMPHYATVVTATFVKIPHSISVVSSHGEVTGIPETATSGTSVTFTVTPNAGYVVSSVSGTFNNGNSSLNITHNSNGTYTFSMPASDVAITVTYFASEDYELLTDLADINAEDTYLLVGTNKDYVMGPKGSNNYATAVSVTPDENGIITSTAEMAIVNFVISDGTYAIHTAEGYMNNTSTSNNGLSFSGTPVYATITLDEQTSAATIQLVDNTSKGLLSFNTGSPRWLFYGTSQGTTYIYKLANKNKVKRPTITGAAGEFLGQYNFIGKDNVTMACATDGATIEYSLDGGTTWLNYSEAVEIVTNAAGNTVEVQARATKSGMDPSEVVTATFTCIKPTAPTFGSNGPDAYVNPVFVYPKSALNDRRAYGEENVSFAYTTTGTVADATSPAVTTKNSNGYYILLDDNATLSVVTMINGIASDPAGGAYTFSVDAPTFSLAGGNYDGNQQTRLSTETKTQQNNLSWNTVIYYTTGNTEFAFDATTGQVTSEGWVAYDATNDPYLDILVQDSPVTIKAVTLSNYFNGQSEYRASDVTSETYVLTAANLAITISPAAGTYVNAQNVTLGVKNEIGDYTIYYTTDGSDPSGNSGIEYTEPITVDHDMTIKVYAMDSRTGDGGTATAEAAYKIGIQPVVYSPFPGTIYKGDDEDINVEMFSVTPNAKVYYTVAEGEGNYPADPTTASTLYSAPVPLETGKVYNFKAIAVIGSMVSTVTPGTFTIQAKGSGWLNVKEMNEDDNDSTANQL